MRALWFGAALSACAISSHAIINVGVHLDSARAAVAFIPV